MTPTQKKIVQETWRQVVPIAEQATMLFYDRLFEVDPGLRRLFSSTNLASQRVKLVQALDGVVGALERIETVVPALEDLGRRHAGYGVGDEHYETVGSALLWTLQRGLGEHWDAEAEAAWSEAYNLVAGVMRGAAAALAEEPAVAVAS